MRGVLLVPVSLALLTGCDHQPKGKLPTAPEPVHPVVAGIENQASDFHVSAPTSDGWAKLSRQERQAAQRTMARVYAEKGDTYAPVQIAIVPNDLPRGAQGLVVRDPSAASQPLLVFSERTFNDSAILTSLAALSEDAQRVRSPSLRRVLHVMEGGSVLSDTDGVMHRFDSPVPAVSPSRRELADRLSGQAVSTRRVEIQGVGSARLLQFD